MTSFFFVFLRNRDTNLKLACLPARSPLPVAALPSVSPIPSAPLTNRHESTRLRSTTAWRAGEDLAPPAIRGNWCNSCLVFPRTKVTALLLFRQRKLERVAECVSRGDARFAPLREAPAGGTRCHQRVGDAALPPDICAFSAMGIGLRTRRST